VYFYFALIVFILCLLPKIVHVYVLSIVINLHLSLWLPHWYLHNFRWWWCPLCSFIVLGSLKQQSADQHVPPLGHIILISSQPVFSLSL